MTHTHTKLTLKHLFLIMKIISNITEHLENKEKKKIKMILNHTLA